MAISRWSGRRLVGTWVAGIVGECVLLALPIAFYVVIANVGPTQVFTASERIDGTRFAERRAMVTARDARAAALNQQMAALKAVEAAESRADIAHSSSAVELVPTPPTPPIAPAEFAPLRSEIQAVSIDKAPWYALPLAGGVAFYILAIPVGLVFITLIWLISRISNPPPPPRSA